MIISTFCFLYLKNVTTKQTVWHCDDVGYVISSDPRLHGLEFKTWHPFYVRTDKNGNKILILKPRESTTT